MALNEAHTYALRGWHVFPLHTIVDGQCSCGKSDCSDAGKHPRVARGLREATRDLARIDEWFGPEAPPSNIGIVTGAISGITVLDIDIGPGKFGAETWAALVKDHGEPVTLMSRTGSGGMHVFFRYNSALKTASNVLGKGVDCRNDGGYVVAPPSLHRSGGAYSWLNDGTDLAELPPHLSRRKETRGRPRKDDMYKGKYSIEQVRGMLACVQPDDRDLWRAVGIVLGREFDRSEAAWDLYVEWAARWGGKKGRNHDEIMHESFHTLSQEDAGGEKLTIGTIVKAALDGGWVPKTGETPIGNFVYYGPGNNYIYRLTGSYWISPAVDSAVSPVNVAGKVVKASDWLRANQLVTSMTCDPSIDVDYVKGKDCRNGEIIDSVGAALYNTYRPPNIELGVPKMALPFLDHVFKVFNKAGDAEQFLNYMAHRVQRPWEKPRFALLIAGGQGIGKDTAIEFCGPALGSWNVANIDPSAFESAFNEFAAAVLVRISEAANLHEMSKWAFNERTKVLIAGSPDVCQINPKYGQKYSVKMYCGVVITTNHLASGIYIPPDDRRYDVIEAATMEEMGLAEEGERRKYFSELWEWFLADGASHVAAYLHARGIDGWSPANGQRKTDAHKTVVAAGLSGDEWAADILDEIGAPAFVRADWIVVRAEAAGEKAADVKRKMGNSLGRLGYVAFRNPGAKDGRWKFDKRSITVYAKADTKEKFDPDSMLKEPF